MPIMVFNNPNFFYKNTGFLDLILDLVQASKIEVTEDAIEDL